jgi:hypothetical protein
MHKPFFLYLPFQECHAPFQVDKSYADLYPDLGDEMQMLCGMVTYGTPPSPLLLLSNLVAHH